MKRVSFALSVGTVVCLTLLASGSARSAEKLLLGFEKAECLKLARHKKEKGQTHLELRYNIYGTYHHAYKGDASEGEWALRKNYKSRFDPFGKGRSESGLAAVQRAGRLLNGSGWMKGRKLAGDWSGYDKLRVDVKSTDCAATIWMRVSDHVTVPVPERRYTIPSGKWVTLEFDLAAAADAGRLDKGKLKEGEALYFRCQKSALYPARVLDRSKIYGVFVNLLKCEAKTQLLLDHVRLVPAGEKVEGKLAIMRDDSPWPKPEALPAVTVPAKPEQVGNGAAGKSEPMAQPISIDASKLGGPAYGRTHNDRCGIAVADASRMAFTVSDGSNRSVFMTADGGKTWTGLDGGPKPTRLLRGRLMMVGACCTPAGGGKDLLIVTLKHCSGGEEPSWVWFKRVAFNGKGWEAKATRVIDVDSWHCPEHTMDVKQLPNGRIWAAYSPASPRGGLVTRYSDDEGATWREGGRLGKHGHGQKRPLLIPYGKGVACFFKQGWQDFFSWAHHDGTKWSAPKKFGKQRGKPVTGTHLDNGEVFVFMALKKTRKLLCLKDGAFKEVTGVPFSPWRLTSDGKRLIALGRVGGKIVMSVRDAGGAWSEKKVLADAPTATDLSVPLRLNHGFMPLIWTDKPGKWVKFLRVALP